ncbi:MAG: DUF1428 domain-containing protein [Planctomycetaceae bacterium]|jgi:uncharacterized protein YbaA (DUF1428 family)|nr:DUF1428 domain-containing protein [Planctomycetaceae bacterium]
MAKYVDGFVIPMPKRNLAAYTKMARLGRKLWLEHGALDYREAVLDHVDTDCTPNFPANLSLKKSDTLIFAYITYRNRKHRDAVNAKVFADPRMQKFANAKMPFEMALMNFGGFRTIVGD